MQALSINMCFIKHVLKYTLYRILYFIINATFISPFKRK